MSKTTGGVRWTIRDVEALPENEWTRYEIIDGELFVTRSPHHKHQHVVGCIFAALNSWSIMGDVITSPLLPNFSCELARLFLSRS